MAIPTRDAIKMLQELRAQTGDENGAQRVAFTDTWIRARNWFMKQIADLPVEQHRDSAGNNWVTLHGASEKTLILGSHLDSVPNGGWLDGALGVLSGLAVLSRIAKKYDGKPPVTIRLVD